MEETMKITVEVNGRKLILEEPYGIDVYDFADSFIYPVMRWLTYQEKSIDNMFIEKAEELS